MATKNKSPKVFHPTNAGWTKSAIFDQVMETLDMISPLGADDMTDQQAQEWVNKYTAIDQLIGPDYYDTQVRKIDRKLLRQMKQTCANK